MLATYNADGLCSQMLDRRKIAAPTLIFIVCCLLSTIRIMRRAPHPARLQGDDVAQRSDQRFAALKASLPQQGIIGYVGDPDNLADYYLAQYALAPLVVDRSPNHPLVVGNFAGLQVPSFPSAHLELMKDFGHGVLLFANKDAR